MNNTTFVVLP